MSNGRITSLEKWNLMYMCCIHYVPVCGVLCNISIHFVYMKTHVRMSIYGVRCVQGINAVKLGRHQGTIRQYWNKVNGRYLWLPSSWYEYVGISINMYDIPDVYFLQCLISRQSYAIYCIPVKFQAIAMHLSCVYCLYTHKRKLKLKGKINNHSNEHIMRSCVNDISVH